MTDSKNDRAGPSPRKAGPLFVLVRWGMRLAMIGLCVAILGTFLEPST